MMNGGEGDKSDIHKNNLMLVVVEQTTYMSGTICTETIFY
jgi:hypothetical protein